MSKSAPINLTEQAKLDLPASGFVRLSSILAPLGPIP